MPAERAARVEEEDGFEPGLPAPLARGARAEEDLEPEASEPLLRRGPAPMIGTYFHSLDDKGRVIVPAKLRPALTEEFWMMLDDKDNISLYPYQTGMDILEHCERMMAENPDDEDVADAVYRVTSRSDLVVVESGFRVSIPEFMRIFANLEKDVVTEGHLNHAVLWERSKWEIERGVGDRLDSQAVRKKQGSLLRAAASGARGNAPARAREEARPHEAEPALEREAQRESSRAVGGQPERGGGRSAGIGAGAAAPAAPAGDGERDPRLLRLSKLGR